MVQSNIVILNPNTSDTITALLRSAALRIAPTSMQITVRAVTVGADALRNAEDLKVAARAVEDVARQISGIDGLIIAAFGDPGLAAARQIAPCPVVGLGESGFLAASAASKTSAARRFGILTLGPMMEPALRAKAAEMGLTDRLIDIRFLDADIPDVARDPMAFVPAIRAEADRLARQGAGALLLGGAPFAGLGAMVHAAIPVIDGLGAAIDRLAAACDPAPAGV